MSRIHIRHASQTLEPNHGWPYVTNVWDACLICMRDICVHVWFGMWPYVIVCPRPNRGHSYTVITHVQTWWPSYTVITHVHTRGHSLTYPLQHTATHCNTLQHTATHCNTLYIHEDTLWRICCNTLQHTVHTRGHSLTYPLTEEIILQIFGSPDPYRNPVRSFERRGLRLLTWNFVANFGDSRDNVFDMYGDSRENLLEILAVVINFSTISPVRGYMCDLHTPRVEWRGLRGNGNAQSWSFLYLQISVDLSGNLWR